MKAFSIDKENNVTVHASRVGALETGDAVFTNDEQLGLIIGPDSKRLVAIWNSLTGVTPVKKFTTSKIAAKRIFAAVQELEPAPVTAGAPTEPDVAPAESPAKKKTTRAKKTPTPATKPNSSREGSKTALVLDLLKRKGGVTSTELMTATGWQPHSVRGFISGTVGKKMGLTVESAKRENGERVYSISA